MRDICQLPDEIAWDVFDRCPYYRFCQFDYASALAIERYINEALNKEHDNSNITLVDQITQYATEMSSYASIEIEEQTEQLLRQALSDVLYNKLAHIDDGLSYLAFIQPGQTYKRQDGPFVKLAKLKDDNSRVIIFGYYDPSDDLVSWNYSKFTLEDLDKNWELTEECI